MRALVALPLPVLHLVFGWSLWSLARARGERRAWWAWVPVLNLLLPFALAGRSLRWGALLALPPVNLAAWALAWSEAFARAGGRPGLGLLMAVPGPNLVLPARVAGRPWAPVVAACAAAAVSLAVAAWGAGRMRADAAGAHAAALAGADVERRREAARALAAMDAAAALPALAGALADDDAEVRGRAAEAIAALGAAARPAAPRLRERLAREDDPAVRGRLARALAVVSPDEAGASGEALLAGLVEAARGTGSRPMPDAALVDALAEAARPAPALLAPALRDGDPGVRWHAAAAYMQLGPQAPGAATALLVAMDDPVWEVRNAAGRALEDVAVDDDVPRLGEALRHASSETRYHAARALARTGPAAAGAMTALLAGLRDDDWEVRMESARALGAAGARARAAEPVLRELVLGDADPQVRAAAAFAIAVVGGPDADEALARVLRDPSPDVRRAAREVLEWRSRGRRR